MGKKVSVLPAIPGQLPKMLSSGSSPGYKEGSTHSRKLGQAGGGYRVSPDERGKGKGKEVTESINVVEKM